jgi:predicted RNA-binding Zn-ribbon protein involved in translation (DUF1610 family)
MLAISGLLLVTAVLLGWRGGAAGPRFDIAADRAFKCTACGHVFEHTLQHGDFEPFECPKCDEMTGWGTETCFWEKDENGEWRAKRDPTFVILKKRMDSSSTEKTNCPDCGREVVGHNPRPPRELMEAAGG